MATSYQQGVERLLQSFGKFHIPQAKSCHFNWKFWVRTKKFPLQIPLKFKFAALTNVCSSLTSVWAALHALLATLLTRDFFCPQIFCDISLTCSLQCCAIKVKQKDMHAELSPLFLIAMSMISFFPFLPHDTHIPPVILALLFKTPQKPEVYVQCWLNIYVLVSDEC